MTTQDIKTKDLTTKAMLVSLNISQWNVHRKSKEATAELAQAFNSDALWTRGNKSLASRKILATINIIVSEARNFHMAETMPWTDGGFRILPSKNYLHYTQKMREIKIKFDDAVVELVSKLPEIKEEAKNSLGKLYNELEYPDAAGLQTEYRLNVAVSPIPSANDFRVTQITDEDINAIQQQITERMETAQKNAMRDLWERLHDVVNKAFEAFNDPNVKFHDSKIENIAEMVEILNRLNMDDDPKLKRMCKVVEERLCNLDPKEVRNDPEERKEAAKDAKSILDTIGSYL